MSRLELVAKSQAQESGFLAVADIASLAKATGIAYRVVGGLMVSPHLAVSGAADPTSRQTLDADLGVTQVAADPALVAGLEGLGIRAPGIGQPAHPRKHAGAMHGDRCADALVYLSDEDQPAGR